MSEEMDQSEIKENNEKVKQTLMEIMGKIDTGVDYALGLVFTSFEMKNGVNSVKIERGMTAMGDTRKKNLQLKVGILTGIRDLRKEIEHQLVSGILEGELNDANTVRESSEGEATTSGPVDIC